MSEEITDKIKDLMENDKNGKLIILITKLVDDRFTSINETQIDINKKLKSLDDKMTSLQKTEEEVKKMKRDMLIMEPLRFYCLHPKLAMILVIAIVLGIVMAYYSGLNTLFNYIIK